MINTVLPLAATAALLAAMAAVAVQIRNDRARQPEPRHRPGPRPQLALPAAPVRELPIVPLADEPEPFNPLTSPLDEVEAFIRSLGLLTPGDLDEAWSEALREDWARTRVAEAGHSWETHTAKFSGAVLPRDDTRELEVIA